jgi:hypothetical protein
MFWVRTSNTFLPDLLSKMALAKYFCSIWGGWPKPLHSLAHALDWLDILIGPGGLLLLGYDLLQPMFYVHGWGLGNNKSKSWM